MTREGRLTVRRALPIVLLVLALVGSAALAGWGYFTVQMNALAEGLSHYGHDDLPEYWDTPDGGREHDEQRALELRVRGEVERIARRFYLGGGALALVSTAAFVAHRRRRKAPQS